MTTLEIIVITLSIISASGGLLFLIVSWRASRGAKQLITADFKGKIPQPVLYEQDERDAWRKYIRDAWEEHIRADFPDIDAVLGLLENSMKKRLSQDIKNTLLHIMLKNSQIPLSAILQNTKTRHDLLRELATLGRQSQGKSKRNESDRL